MSEIKAFTVAVGNFNPFIKASRDAMKLIKKLDGLYGVHPQYPRGTLLLFKTKNEATRARNLLSSYGVLVGDHICECYVPSEG